MTTKIEISHRTIIFVVIFLLALWLLFTIRDILYLLFIAFILMSALRPLVDGLERLKIPRVLSILLIYALVFGFFGMSFAGVIPSLVIQTARLIQELPVFVNRVAPNLGLDVRALTQQIAPISENIVNVTLGIFSNILSTLTILIFTFYFLLERKHTETYLADFMGEDAAKKVVSLVADIEHRLGAWVAGEVLLMTIIGVLSYIGLTILRVDFALPLAIMAGILEAVPMIGPIVSAIPAILVALSTSPILAASVLALYIIIQQIENNLVVPIVMKKSVGISPILTIFALLVGGRLGGIVGAILAIPGVLVIQTIFGAYLAHTTSEIKIPKAPVKDRES